MLCRTRQLIGYPIQATDCEFGEVEDFLFDDRNWNIRHLIVGIRAHGRSRGVLLPPACVRQVNTERQVIAVTLSHRELEQSPGVKADLPVSWQKMSEHPDCVYAPPWCGAAGMQFLGIPTVYYALDRNQTGQDANKGNPLLRSVAEVATYVLKASDGRAGFIRDFLVDVEDWSIQYAVVKTRRWLLGRRVLVPSASLKRVDWDKAEVEADLTRDQVRSSPRFDPRISTEAGQWRALRES